MGHVIAFAKLCKQVGTLQTLFIRCGDRIPKHVSLHPVGSIELLPEVKARSDAFIERVCSFAAYRTLTVAARRYKRNGDMHGFGIEAQKVHKAVADVQACIVIRPEKGFSKGLHLCDGTICNCNHPDKPVGSECYRRVWQCLQALYELVIPSVEPAQSR